ncbi:MAG: tetratricopeptide repeat protein [Bacteroidetes bacterium]|nr:tetratricopeptide repeat protein [Bacteroidota bacterium]
MMPAVLPNGTTSLAPDLRVFISSTFNDMCSEREHLMKQVFPELRSICRARGGDLTEIDLRWGITEQQARSGAIVKACLEEISRHQPWFIGIIGDRYGWIPARRDVADPRLHERYPWLRAAVDERRSLIELEVIEGALNRPLTAANAFFYFRASQADSGGAQRAESDEARLRLVRLKERIRRSGLPFREGFTSPEQLAGWVREDMMRAINRVYPCHSEADSLQHERAAHEAFERSRRRAYVETPVLLERLDALLCTVPAANPVHGRRLVVTGVSGAGKSALLSFWSDRFRRRMSDAFIITHYIGASSGNLDHLSLLRWIMAEIGERYCVPDALPSRAEDIVREFPVWLSRVQDEDLIIVIDALNQMDEASQTLAWLPEHLPERVAVIVSATEGTALDAIRDRAWPELEVRPLTLDQRRAVVELYLEEFGKRFDTGQLERISRRAVSANPLYLRTQLEELRTYGSFEGLNDRIDYYLAASGLDDLFQRVLARLENDYGVDTVREVMTLVWASRDGLADGEVRELAGAEDAAIGRLLAALGYHMTYRNGLLSFYHDHLRRAVHARYISGIANGERELHHRLAHYFASQPVGRRRAAEEPWHWCRAEAWEALRDAIADVQMMLAITRHGADYELVQYWVAIASRGDIVAAYERGMEQFEARERSPAAVAEALDALAKFLIDAGRYDAAAQFARRAVMLRERAGDLADPSIAAALDNLATLLYHDGRSEEALEPARRALAIRRATLQEHAPEIARNLADIGALLYAIGAREEAEAALGEALAVTGPRDLPVVAMILNNLGALRLAAKAFHEAAPHFEQARDINRRLLGAEHPEVASNLVNLAFAQAGMGHAADAERTYGEALAIVERWLGPEHPQAAVIATNLGRLYQDTGRMAVAEKQFVQALAIREKIAGHEHPETVLSMMRLAYVLMRLGRNAECRRLYEEALRIRRAMLPENHPDVQWLVDRIAILPCDPEDDVERSEARDAAITQRL